MANNGREVYGKREAKASNEIIMYRPRITQVGSLFFISPAKPGRSN